MSWSLLDAVDFLTSLAKSITNTSIKFIVNFPLGTDKQIQTEGAVYLTQSPITNENRQHVITHGLCITCKSLNEAAQLITQLSPRALD